MKAIAAVLLVFVAGCAGGPVPAGDGLALAPEEDFALEFHDADLRDVVAFMARKSGHAIAVEDTVSERVTISTPRCFWRLGLAAVAKAAHCDLMAEPDGSILLRQPITRRLDLEACQQRDVVGVLGKLIGVRTVVASDADGVCSIHTALHTNLKGAAEVVDRLLADQGLHVARVDGILVVAKAELEPETCPIDTWGRGTFHAFHAPADGWFALLERLTGTRVAHGDAPVDLALEDVRAVSVQRASALVSRVSGRARHLEDLPEQTVLPSGRSMTYELQATVTQDLQFLDWGDRPPSYVRPLALVDGRVLAEGDEIAPGVKIERIDERSIDLVEQGGGK